LEFRQDGAVPQWLVVSIVASVVLTVVLNLAVRLFPGAGRRIGESIDRAVARHERPPADEQDGSRVRVIVPWRLMLVGSLLLTLVLNLAVWLSR
jgi:hypothetical protein